jgi:tetratricopeptide (TPR) repeat protein
MGRYSMNTAKLDEDELVHLALHASGEHRPDEAMAYLKRAVLAFPNSAKAHYLLGAEHAQIGMVERAVEEMSEAVRLDPSLTTAQFQLGLLHFTAARRREAELAWKPLDKLERSDALYLFKCALLHWLDDKLPECIRDLELGIKNNTFSEPLNEDMRRVLHDVQARAASTSAASRGSPVATQSSTHALLSAYQKNRDKSERE